MREDTLKKLLDSLPPNHTLAVVEKESELPENPYTYKWPFRMVVYKEACRDMLKAGYKRVIRILEG